MPPRVLIIHNIVAPYRLPIFEKLSADFDVTVYFCAENDPAREWDADLDKYSFNYRVLPQMAIGPVKLNYTVLRHLIRKNFDAVVLSDTPEAIPANAVTALYAKACGIPYVVWTEVITKTEGQEVSEETSVSSLKTATFDTFREILYRYADGFIAYSGAAASYLRDRGVSDEEIAEGIQVVPRERLPSPSISLNVDGPLVLYVGYLNCRKGVDILIKAYKKSNIDDGKLIIVGTGPEENRLRSLAADDPDIEFTGYVTEEQKASYYDAADVFVLPTRHDAWGLVVNEAMHYGVPVIVSAAAGSAELVERYDNGFVVPPENTDALATHLTKIFEDPKQRCLFSQRSRAAEEVTDVDIGTEPFHEVLCRVLE